jgi:osmotically-inducible protein OsmY
VRDDPASGDEEDEGYDMTASTRLKTDREVKAAVTAELEWAPEIDATRIGVAVDDGVVVLTGEVRRYSEVTAAKKAALRTIGVGAVVNDLRVHPSSRYSISEVDVAKEVEHALRAAGDVPDTVKAEVVDHDVTLIGFAEWDYQRRAAKRVVRHLRGVTSVTDAIALTSRVSASDAAERIEQAILRNALLDAKAIEVSVTGDKVTLTGTVRSWAERRQAGLAAWSSPSVSDVYNHIVVRDP